MKTAAAAKTKNMALIMRIESLMTLVVLSLALYPDSARSENLCTNVFVSSILGESCLDSVFPIMIPCSSY